MAGTHVVAIVGGAVAGSEAAALFTERGARAVVLEQGDRPYGKIEDGLPRWHEKLREKEYGRIDANLDREGVDFVPRTRVGEDLGFDALLGMGFSAIVLANGAWRDRPLPLEGVERFVDRGLLYQNPLVHWFNHQEEPSYDGPRYELPEGAIVVGGGLASIDVVKILSLETYARALKQRGWDVDLVDLELRGIPAWCAKNGVDVEALDVTPPTLFYRRRMEDMPLASAPEGADEAQLAKVRRARIKIMRRVMERYLVRFEPLHTPRRPIVEDDRMVGLVFARTEIVDGRVKPIEGSEREVRAPLTVSSIGSVPEPLPGGPMKGELYDFADWDTGAVRDLPTVFGLGNVLTGRGNIRESRANAQAVARGLIDCLDVAPEGAEKGCVDDALARVHDEAHGAAERLVDRAMLGPAADVERIEAWVRARWAEIGYEGYADWIAKVRPDGG